MSTAIGAANIRLPDDLTELDRWAVWRMESGQKVPYRVDGRKASSTNPSDWGDFETAKRAFARGKYSGLAFAFFAEDGLAGIDLDDCLDDAGELKPWAQIVVEHFFDSYMEISPSGKGVKIWVRGSLPANVAQVKFGDGGIELYDHARYFTVTGRLFRGAPLEVAEHHRNVATLYERLTQGRAKRGWPLQPLEGGRIPYGRQHSILVSIVGTLRARRVCDEAIEACLQIMNERQCERPGPPENIRRIVQSSRRWGAA